MSTEEKFSDCVLLLNGYPGSGKFTIGQKLQSLYGPSRTRLYHKNHLLAASPDGKPVPDICPSSPQYQKWVGPMGEYRQSIFRELAEEKEKDLLIIMTYTNLKFPVADAETDAAELLADHVRIARARGVPLVLVDLSCNLKTNMQRQASKETRDFDGCGCMLISFHLNYPLVKPFEYPGVLEGVKVHHYEVDTNSLTADEATLKVSSLLNDLFL